MFTNKILLKYSIILLLLVSFFCPFYFYTTNKMTITFSSTCFIAFIISCLLTWTNVKGKIKPYRWYLFALFIYGSIFLITNILYLDCYWEMVNRLICFWFLLRLIQKGELLRSHNIEKWIIGISFMAAIFSIALYSLRIEELSFAGGINYRIQGQHFIDKRLTYVFSHKAGYGLVLTLLIAFALQNRNCFKTTMQWYIYLGVMLLTVVLTGSATSWIAVIVLFVFLLLSDVSIKRTKKITILVLLVLLMLSPFAVAYLADYLFSHRNLATGGSRFMIWSTAFSFLKTNTIGLGNAYYSTLIDGVNNFHNVFLNEMLHFSIPIGILYFLQFIYIVCMSYKIKKSKGLFLTGIWISVFMLLMIDQSLVVSNMPLVIFLIYEVFFYNQKSVNKVKIHSSY